MQAQEADRAATRVGLVTDPPGAVAFLTLRRGWAPLGPTAGIHHPNTGMSGVWVVDSKFRRAGIHPLGFNVRYAGSFRL